MAGWRGYDPNLDTSGYRGDWRYGYGMQNGPTYSSYGITSSKYGYSDPNRDYVPANDSGDTSPLDKARDEAVQLYNDFTPTRNRIDAILAQRDKIDRGEGARFSGFYPNSNPWSMSQEVAPAALQAGGLPGKPEDRIRAGGQGANQGNIDAYWKRVKEAYPEVQFPAANPNVWEEMQAKQLKDLRAARIKWDAERSCYTDTATGQVFSKQPGTTLDVSKLPEYQPPRGSWEEPPPGQRELGMEQMPRWSTPEQYRTWRQAQDFIDQQENQKNIQSYTWPQQPEYNPLKGLGILKPGMTGNQAFAAPALATQDRVKALLMLLSRMPRSIPIMQDPMSAGWQGAWR